MDQIVERVVPVQPFSLRDAPSLIERVFPAQKISVETKREFDAHGAQTLTSLGSYWKGRKRLVYVRACLLASLLPATDDPEADLKVFEMLMAIDDRAFLDREKSMKPSEVAKLAIKARALRAEELSTYFTLRKQEPTMDALLQALESGKLVWRSGVSGVDRIRLAAHSQLSYEDLVSRSLRPEELPESAYDRVWETVNAHLGTSATSISELVEQLGIMRYGRRPQVGDTFSGSGSIPFEAARVGCDAYASDLNPLACMLTWGAMHLIGSDAELKFRLNEARSAITSAVEAKLARLGVEHDASGNRAKAYLYCVEVLCPSTGWVVPVLPSLVVSRIKRTIARLVPNHAEKRFDVEIETGVSAEEMQAAKVGTYQKQHLVYELDGETHRTPIATIRGDRRLPGQQWDNQLRRWSKSDVRPQSGDVLGERLYCIQWMKAETLGKARPETFFSTPDADDIAREDAVTEFVTRNLEDWQSQGHVPDMEIEPGEKTNEVIRTRGWSHWHHLYTPRQLLIAALVAEEIGKVEDEDLKACLAFDRAFLADKSSRLSQWRLGSPSVDGRAPSADGVEHVFYNQALNTFYNFGSRAFYGLRLGENSTYKTASINQNSVIKTLRSEDVRSECDIWITDPPYADAVNYHEITEFFIAWLRRNPPAPFADWIWDSRRSLAIQGDGDEFRTAMVRAYRAMADKMPDNGLQVVMFTHQDVAVWADMAQIFWGAGLQVMAAWYVATETTSDTKKGGYVQGTVTLVLRKRAGDEDGFRHEIVQEVKAEVAQQIDSMVGLNQHMQGHGRSGNLFEDADLQMAGYAAALRVLTGYRYIDGTDMAGEAVRPRQRNEKSMVSDVIQFAVQVANEHLVPEGLEPSLWERMTNEERYYLKMAQLESKGFRKLDNYQNFARAFRISDHAVLLGSNVADNARLLLSTDLKHRMTGTDGFGSSKLRAVLYGIWEIRQGVEGEDVLNHLRGICDTYFASRDDLRHLADYLDRTRRTVDEDEASAARILSGLIRNERLG